MQFCLITYDLLLPPGIIKGLKYQNGIQQVYNQFSAAFRHLLFSYYHFELQARFGAWLNLLLLTLNMSLIREPVLPRAWLNNFIHIKSRCSRNLSAEFFFRLCEIHSVSQFYKVSNKSFGTLIDISDFSYY